MNGEELGEGDEVEPLSASLAGSPVLGGEKELVKQGEGEHEGEEKEVTKKPPAPALPQHDLETREPWTTRAAYSSAHALERDIELVRLETENEELRRMLGIESARRTGSDDSGKDSDENNSEQRQQQLESLEQRQGQGAFEAPLPPRQGLGTIPRRLGGVGMGRGGSGTLGGARKGLWSPSES